MKVLTGDLFNVNGERLLVYNEQDLPLQVGEKIEFSQNAYIVRAIIPPSRPDGKWSISI